MEQANAGAVNEDGTGETQTSSQTLVQDIASAALTAVLQFGVRTGKLFFHCLSDISIAF